MLKRLLAVAVAITLANSSPTKADLVWTWEFNGTEAGTFRTDGTLADANNATPGSPFTFTFDGSSFDVTASTFAANIGKTYSDQYPMSGFIWDGAAPTSFFRSNTPATPVNANFIRDDDNQFIYALDAPNGALTDTGFSSGVVFSAPLTITPVPEPSALLYGGLISSIFGCGVWAKRRFAT